MNVTFVTRSSDWESRDSLEVMRRILRFPIEVKVLAKDESLVHDPLSPILPVALIPLSDDEMDFHGWPASRNSYQLIQDGRMPEGIEYGIAIRLPVRSFSELEKMLRSDENCFRSFLGMQLEAAGET